jgi:hypothetical protein
MQILQPGLFDVSTKQHFIRIYCKIPNNLFTVMQNIKLKFWVGIGGSKLLLGHSRKHPYHPHRGNRTEEINPPTPFGCPNTFTIIRNNFFSPPPPDGRNFLRGGSMDLFWNDPFCDIFTMAK